MEVLDTTIANVALRYIAGGLSSAVTDSEWVVTSDHKYLRICDLCKELGIIGGARIYIAAEQERQAKTDALFGAVVPVN
jgi:hypothetical protein